jgi:transposase-like protein
LPHRYSSEEKQQILDRAKANRGDVTRTAAEFGIHPATIYKWRKTTKFANSLSSFSSPISPTSDSTVGTGLALSTDSQDTYPIPPDDLQALRDLKSQMLREAEYISVNIRSAVDDAPLSQRVTALAQLIDRIIKLAAELPAPKEKQVIRIAGDPEEMYEPDID